MKKIFLIFLLLASNLFGQNSIYLDQISTSGTVDIIQTGSSNRIGADGTASTITGDNGVFTIKQIGDGNAIDFNLTGDDWYFKLWNTGDNNTQKIFLNGSNNNFNTVITGNSNSIIFNSDGTSNGTTQGTTAYGDFDFLISGNSNTFNIGILTGSYNKLDYDVTGNSNTFDLKQTGLVSGAAGHNQTVDVLGSSNDITVHQTGTEQQTAVLNVTGSSNTITVTQGTTGGI